MHPQPSQPTTLPLDALISLWESEVRTIDPATHLLIQQVFRQFGTALFLKNDLEGIRRLIGPILAQNEEEQEIFREIFEEKYLPYLKESLPFAGEAAEDSEPEEPLSDQLKRLSQKWRPILYGGIVVVVFGLYALFVSESSPPPQSPFPAYSSSEPSPLPQIPGAPPKSIKKLKKPSPQSGVDLPTDFLVFPQQKSQSIAIDEPLEFSPNIYLPYYHHLNVYTQHTDYPYWDFGNGKTADSLLAEASYTQPGIYPVTYTFKISFIDKTFSSQQLLFVPTTNPMVKNIMTFYWPLSQRFNITSKCVFSCCFC